MKKIFTLLTLSVGMVSFSQMELHKEGVALGSAISIDSASSSSDHFALGETTNDKVYIVNTGSTEETVTFQRVRRYHKAGWTDQVCDDLICFDASNTQTWNRPGNPPLTLAAGDSSVFEPKVYTHGIDGCSIYTYIIKYGGFQSYGDSVQVTYTIGGIDCFLGTDEMETTLDYSVYPNPANEVLTISISENNTSISIFDIVGKNVAEMKLINGTNSLNIENLNAGVYFYSIKRNGNIIETKKLIVQ